MFLALLYKFATPEGCCYYFFPPRSSVGTPVLSSVTRLEHTEEGLELLAVVDGLLLEVGHDQRANCLANAKDEDQDALIVDYSNSKPTKTITRSTETIINSSSACACTRIVSSVGFLSLSYSSVLHLASKNKTFNFATRHFQKSNPI